MSQSLNQSLPPRLRAGLAFEASPIALTRSHTVTRRMARFLSLGLAVSLLFLLFAPWRQSVRAEGRVIAFSPSEREQQLEAPIKGRIVKWHVREGSVVRAGDPIVDLSDNDPSLGVRLADQRDAARARVDAAKLAVTIGQSRVSSVDAARRSAITTAELAVQIAKDKLDAADQELLSAEAEVETARINAERTEALEKDQLASRRQHELAQLKLVQSRTKRDAARAKQRAAKREVASARAKLANAIGKESSELQKAEESLQKLVQERTKAEQELTKTEIELTRQGSMSVLAPRAGTVLKLVANAEGQWVKPGDALAVLVPATESRAVELWVSGNDAPLVTAGREVRLQFEGWPAVQFAGWPSVAVGTFEGRVALVDAADDGKGRFRVVIVPGESQAWPDARYLRQGVRAGGWVLLNEVSVGYEIWRQLNGFPPAVEQPKPDAKQASPSIAQGEK